MLAHFDDDVAMEIHIDASNVNLGGVVVQHQNGVGKAIIYASCALSHTVSNYSVTEKYLAVEWAVTKFCPYLHGITFQVISDHH